MHDENDGDDDDGDDGDGGMAWRGAGGWLFSRAPVNTTISPEYGVIQWTFQSSKKHFSVEQTETVVIGEFVPFLMLVSCIVEMLRQAGRRHIGSTYVGGRIPGVNMCLLVVWIVSRAVFHAVEKFRFSSVVRF